MILAPIALTVFYSSRPSMRRNGTSSKTDAHAAEFNVADSVLSLIRDAIHE